MGLRRCSILGLVLLVSVGAVLRLNQLGFNSLWNDELTVWQVTQIRPFFEMLRFHMATDLNPPAYWVLQYPFTFFLPQTEFGVRFPAALFGMLVVPAVFFWGRALFSERIGWTAALLATFSYQGIYFSQEARPYSLLVLLSTVSSWMWFEVFYFEARAARWKNVLLFVSVVVLAYTHYFGTMMVGVQGLCAGYLAWRRSRVRDWLVTYVFAGVAFTPWLPSILSQLKPIDVWMSPPELRDVYTYLKFLFERSGVYALIGPLAVLAFVVDRYRSRTRRDVSAVLLVVAFSLIPFIVAFVRSRLATPMLTHRYMLIALPAVHLLAAAAFLGIAEKLPRPRSRELALVLVPVLLVFINLDTLIRRRKVYTKLSKDRNREAGELAVATAKSRAAVLIYTGKNEAIASYYLPPWEQQRFLRYNFSPRELQEALTSSPRHVVFLAASVSYPSASLEPLASRYRCDAPVTLPRNNHVVSCTLKD